MINVLITTLTEVLSAQKDYSTGNSEAKDVDDAKKRFAQSLHEYIDYRIQKAFDIRRKHQSQDRIKVADSINSSVKSTASTIRSISALNSAPPPPDLSDPEGLEKWKEIYEKWYETKRKDGINIE